MEKRSSEENENKKCDCLNNGKCDCVNNGKCDCEKCNCNDCKECNHTEDSLGELEYKQKYEELDDRYKRIFAEFENYKKRIQKERIYDYENAKFDLVQSLLPIIDSIHQAKTFDTKDKDFKEGIEQVYKQFEIFLKKNEIEELETMGQHFDPELHDAISMREEKDVEPGIIIEEFRKGYKMGDKIIRHAMVVVSK